MSKSKLLSFKNQIFYIGIDVHKRQWNVTIRSKGLTLKTMTIGPDPQELFKYMSKNYPDGTYVSTYEAGGFGFWIHRELVKLGFINSIVNPADIPTSHKEKDRKSDSIDSNKLARELSNGTIKGIFALDEKQEGYRLLSRCLFQYSKRSAQVKNRIKALLTFKGIRIDKDEGKHWSRIFLNVLSEIKFSNEAEHITMRQHLEEIEHIRNCQLNLLRSHRKISNENKIIQAIRSVPGIGVKISFALYAELVTMDRFSSFDNLASYVGLVPSTASSGDRDNIKGMTNRQCRNLRFLLIEAAWRAVRVDPVLTMCFEQLSKRMPKNRAIVRITKKLLNRIRAIWISTKQYEIGLIENVPTSKKSIEIETMTLSI